MFVSYSRSTGVRRIDGALRDGCVKIASKNTLSNTVNIFQLYIYIYIYIYMHIILLYDKFWFPNLTDADAVLNDSESDGLYLLPLPQSHSYTSSETQEVLAICSFDVSSSFDNNNCLCLTAMQETVWNWRSF